MKEGKWDEKSHSEARQKLLAALDTSRFNAERVLQRLPVDGLYEERAFLLGRMRQHRLALTLYAHKVCPNYFPSVDLDSIISLTLILRGFVFAASRTRICPGLL